MFENYSHLKELIYRDPVLWSCALLGSGLFLLQFLSHLVGGEMEEVSDGADFQWFSKQTLTGFLMLFGWSALTCKYQFGLAGAWSWSIAALSGLIAAFISGFLFKMVKKLHSPGTVFRIEDAIGKQAMVYQRIPLNGVGKVSVCIQDFSHELDAMSLDSEEIPSFVSVQIVKKQNDHTVIVTQ